MEVFCWYGEERQYTTLVGDNLWFCTAQYFTHLSFFRLHQISVFSEWTFHASRAEQIYENLKSGHLITYIATSTFGNIGTGSFLFYPTVFLYPWAVFRLFVSPITAYMMFLTLFFFPRFKIEMQH